MDAKGVAPLVQGLLHLGQRLGEASKDRREVSAVAGSDDAHVVFLVEPYHQVGVFGVRRGTLLVVGGAAAQIDPPRIGPVPADSRRDVVFVRIVEENVPVYEIVVLLIGHFHETQVFAVAEAPVGVDCLFRRKLKIVVVLVLVFVFVVVVVAVPVLVDHPFKQALQLPPLRPADDGRKRKSLDGTGDPHAGLQDVVPGRVQFLFQHRVPVEVRELPPQHDSVFLAAVPVHRIVVFQDQRRHRRGHGRQKRRRDGVVSRGGGGGGGAAAAASRKAVANPGAEPEGQQQNNREMMILHSVYYLFSGGCFQVRCYNRNYEVKLRHVVWPSKSRSSTT
mmetsp:Transcript_20102/g.41654  ORF Transcript_20102/g.41654 Transcript_20102/m.41654 type:complete len:334 (-) Transcript_20102:28-1029(-)